MIPYLFKHNALQFEALATCCAVSRLNHYGLSLLDLENLARTCVGQSLGILFMAKFVAQRDLRHQSVKSSSHG
jgi:hypothetical protein